MIKYQKDDFDASLDDIMSSINDILSNTGDGYETNEKEDENKK